MTKVLVVDDNAIVRAGLQAVLGRVDTVAEVLEAENAFTALEMTSAHSPDIILLDVSMPPGRSGLDILPELVGSASVIMLTSMKDPALIRRALDAGARGYLVHGQLGVNEVAGAIETCRHGGLVLGREAADVMLHPSDDNRPNPLRERLTDREAEILDLAADGLSNAEIAETLVVSATTVKTHVGNVLAKFNVRDRVQAVVVAYESGLMT